MNFADTNWLEALYFESPEAEQQARESTSLVVGRHADSNV